MLVKFPAPFLIELVSNCMKTLKQKLLVDGKLPPDVHYQAFGPGEDDIQFLDRELLPKGVDVRHNLKWPGGRAAVPGIRGFTESKQSSTL